MESHNYEEELKAQFTDLTKRKDNLESSLKLAKRYLKFIEDNPERFVYVDTLSANALHSDLENQLSDTQRSIEKTQKQLAADLGPNKEFIGLLDQCLQKQISNYLYKVCIFDEALQIEGSRSFLLG